MTGDKMLKQGAEAKIYIGSVQFNGEKCLVKERFPKKYRHPELDKQLTKERMRAESKAISRCLAAGILVPKIYQMDINERKIYMEYFDKSITVKYYINDVIPKCHDDSLLDVLGTKIGSVIGTMHSNNIIHGDLTTSNMLVNPKETSLKEFDLVMIDFGLSHYNQSTEDKGVDLYVLERALLSTHSSVPTIFDIILKAYQTTNTNGWKDVVAKFEDVRARGRKRTMVG